MARDKNDNLCWAYTKGKCTRGDSCCWSHEAAATSWKAKEGKGDKVMIAKMASRLEEMDKRLASMGMQDGKKGNKRMNDPNHDPKEIERIQEEPVTKVMQTRVKRNWYKVMNARVVTRARMKRRTYR